MAGLLQSQSKVEPQCGFAAAHRGKPSAYRNLPLTFFEAAPQFTEAQPRPRPVKRLRKGKPFRYVLRHSRFSISPAGLLQQNLNLLIGLLPCEPSLTVVPLSDVLYVFPMKNEK